MERKAVKFITVFILSLVLVVACPLLGFQSEAASLVMVGEKTGSITLYNSLSYDGQPNILTTSNGVTSVTNYTGSFSGWVKLRPVTVWVDDVSIPRGHSILISVAVYGNVSADSVLSNLNSSSVYVGSPRYNLSKNGFIHTDVLFAEPNTTSFYINSWDDRYFNLDVDLYLDAHYSGSFARDTISLSCPVTYKISVYDMGVQANYVVDSQGHSDAQNQLDESKKQTDAMTKFDGKSDMDKNSSDLNDSLSGYDEAQQSIFSSSTASIEKFDVDNLFNFTVNISSALLVWNNLMVSIVASMGDFSLIYTISMGLVFIGIVVGIWRFFVK